MNEVKYIKSRLTETERLLGLTEEALELALSALKLRRVMDGTNPTPVTLEQATANLLEEFGDVLNTVEVLVTPTQNELAMQLRQTKRTRWVERLKAAGPEPLVVEHRQQRCPHCGWTWWEDCDATDYPNYCPQCGGELHGGWTVTEPEEEKKRGGVAPVEIKRGDIFYVGGGYATGSEQRAGRPAIVVSNDKNNEHSPTVEMVYLTTQPKRDLPTHVPITSLSRESIAICEQITTVAIERIGKYNGRCTPAEMAALDEAMLISLALNVGRPSADDAQLMTDLMTQLTEAEARCTVLQQMYDSLLSRVVK